MNKYLNIFVAVLFSALTVSFVSCSKDDEPNSNDPDSGDVRLTIDNQEYKFGMIIGNVDYSWSSTFDNPFNIYSCILYTENENGDAFSVELGNWDFVKEGTVINNSSSVEGSNDVFVNISWVTSKQVYISHGGRPNKGEVKITKITKETVTINFSNCTFDDYTGVPTCSVNGTVTLPLDDMWY